MVSRPFTLQLVALRCLTAQEHDGDEIYITADGLTLWSVGGLRMSHRLDNDQQVDEVDFLHGQLHTSAGWVAMQSYTQGDFRLQATADAIRLELWERDLLLSDDLLGEALVSAADAGGGKIQQAFTGEGAHYTLTYEVTLAVDGG